MGKGENTRAAILSEALEVASVKGLEGISIGDLASRIGMSKSGLFAHFGSKDSLQQAVVETVVSRFAENVVLPVLGIPSGEQRLRALFVNWLHWTDEINQRGGCPLIHAAIEFDDQPGLLRDYVVDQQERWLDSIHRMAQKAVEQGEFREDLDTRQFAFEFNSIGLGHNNASRLLRDPDARRFAFASFERLLDDARGGPNT